MTNQSACKHLSRCRSVARHPVRTLHWLRSTGSQPFSSTLDALPIALGGQALTKKVKKISNRLVFAFKGGFPMRASDSSVGGVAGQFHSTRCDPLVAAEGGLSP